MKLLLVMTSACLLTAGCGADTDADGVLPETASFASDDASAVSLSSQLVNIEGMQWYCAGLFDGSQWLAQFRISSDNTAVYTFASGEALMATWSIDENSRDISWDIDLDGQIDRTATLVAPILAVATDSFHNIRETFTEVSISNERVLSLTRIKERDAALLSGDISCNEQV